MNGTLLEAQSNVTALDEAVYVLLPYVAIVIFALGTFKRIKARYLPRTDEGAAAVDKARMFWGATPWYYSFFVVLAAYLFFALVPGWVLGWNASPVRVYVLEGIVLSFAFSMLVSLLCLAARCRCKEFKEYAAFGDRIMLPVMILLSVTGIVTAVFHGWMSSWFSSLVSPYLLSLLMFSPDLSGVSLLPDVFKFHMGLIWLALMLFHSSSMATFVMPPQWARKCCHGGAAAAHGAGH